MSFDLRQALRNLEIEVKPFGYQGDGQPILPFSERDGLRGYSHDRWLAVNPDERWPAVVTFHEMGHILRGDTTLYKKFNADPWITPGELPSWEFIAMHEYKERNHDIIETECHVTGIFAARLTDSPMDLKREIDHLHNCYTRGRGVPEEVKAAAYKTAKKIWAAGKVDARSRVGGLVAA